MIYSYGYILNGKIKYGFILQVIKIKQHIRWIRKSEKSILIIQLNRQNSVSKIEGPKTGAWESYARSSSLNTLGE